MLNNNCVFICCVSANLASEITNCPLLQRIFSRIFVEQTALGDRDRVSLWSETQAFLFLITKDSGSLNSGFFSFKRITVCATVTWLSLNYPVRTGAWENWHKNADALATARINILLLLLKNYLRVSGLQQHIFMGRPGGSVN